jgi:hypothetical protein
MLYAVTNDYMIYVAGRKLATSKQSLGDNPLCGGKGDCIVVVAFETAIGN